MPGIMAKAAKSEAAAADKKKTKKAAAAAADAPAATDGHDAKPAKASKKRKAAEAAASDHDDGAPIAQRTRSNSITSVDLNVGVVGDAEEASAPKAKKAKKDKAAKAKADDGATAAADGEDAEADPHALENFRISPETVELLKKRGIAKLFPIQARTYDAIYDGKDVVGQAKTGSGKTLSFALPMVERMMASPMDRKRGRPPVAIVMAPTRELALQIEREIAFLCQGRQVATVCLYGGAPYDPQETALRQGVDVVIGTPGRIIDHIERGRLVLDKIRFVVLDEADRMLEVGFAENIDTILGKLYENADEARRPQTLLFSATMPRWVQETSRKYLRPDKFSVDLVGKGANSVQTSDTIQHLAIKCPYHERNSTLRDIVQVYSGMHGRTIIFASTKKEANELSLNDVLRQECQVLHGDIPQKQREMTLAAFREGKVRCLVATDVAARGIDIPEVDLVIQTEPPEKVEDYIHRSGRTGRAGKSGVCILFYKQQQEWALKNIENRSGVRFKRIGAPQPADIMKAAARDARQMLQTVSPSAVPYFREVAQELIDEHGDVDALAMALAHICGQKDAIEKRSLLSSTAGYTTLTITFPYEIRTPSYVFGVLRNHYPPEIAEAVRGMKMLASKCGGAFDLPDKLAEKLQSFVVARAAQLWKNGDGATLEAPTVLPELEEAPAQGNGGGNFGRFGGGGGGGGRSWGGRGGGGDRRSGFGGRGGGGGGGGGGRFRGGRR